jgi:hypothetical protein
MMQKRFFIALASAISVVALGVSFLFTSPSLARTVGAKSSKATQEQGGGMLDTLRQTLVVDVAVDGRVFAVNGGRTIFDAKRGDSFIVKGKIYPGGTIAPGGTMQNPGPFNPDTTPGSIGNWICRGNFEFDIGQILAGAAPHVYSTQYHLFNDGSGLVTDGPEGGAPQVRALIGGIGAYEGSTAEVIEEPLGVNSTGLFNIRFTFKFKKKDR